LNNDFVVVHFFFNIRLLISYFKWVSQSGLHQIVSTSFVHNTNIVLVAIFDVQDFVALSSNFIISLIYLM